MRSVSLVVHPASGVSLVDRDFPALVADEVLLEVRAAGICHTDTYLLNGTHPGATYPRVPGHEFSGVVLEVGPGVPADLTGSRVAVQSTMPCLQCESCRSERLRACPNVIALGTTADGGWQTHAIVPARALITVPDQVGDDEAALFEPAANAMAALRAGGVTAQDDVVVIGPGAIGTMTALLARQIGVRSLTVVGLPHDVGRLAVVEQVAQARTVTLALDGALDDVAECSVVVQCAPSTRASALALGLLADEGRLVIEGYAGDATAMPIGADEVNQRSLTIRGVNGWTPLDFRAVTDLVAEGSVSFARLPVRVYPLEQHVEALAAMHATSDAVRVMFHPRGSD